MASKLFAPFKKFPQQLPIFKKLTDKFKDVTMSNYVFVVYSYNKFKIFQNAVYGMLEDVTCHSFDNNLYLLALGTKKGEIKMLFLILLDFITQLLDMVPPVSYIHLLIVR